MPRNKDEVPAVRVYTVCDESKYLIVRNVPTLGCDDELWKLFGTFEECKPMEGEDCEAFTDVYWIKFRQVNNARFVKRKLDESVFLGNRLQVSYAHEYESLSDTKEKLEGRRREVLARLNPGKSEGSMAHTTDYFNKPLLVATASQVNFISHPTNDQQRNSGDLRHDIQSQDPSLTKDYFPTQSMNHPVKLVREKLNKIQSSAEALEVGLAKKTRVDNRRRIYQTFRASLSLHLCLEAAISDLCSNSWAQLRV